MEFQLSYFKSWKMMLWKCCTQYASKFGKLSSGHGTWKGQFSFQSQIKAMPKNAQTTTQLHSCQVISAWSATWSVHDLPNDQWMISDVISAWSATWTLHVQPRDHCIFSHVISAWSAIWRVQDQPSNQCMHSHVLRLWSASLSVRNFRTFVTSEEIYTTSHIPALGSH